MYQASYGKANENETGILRDCDQNTHSNGKHLDEMEAEGDIHIFELQKATGERGEVGQRVVM